VAKLGMIALMIFYSGKTWDDTWEPASEFAHFMPNSPHPNQLSA